MVNNLYIHAFFIDFNYSAFSINTQLTIADYNNSNIFKQQVIIRTIGTIAILSLLQVIIIRTIGTIAVLSLHQVIIRTIGTIAPLSLHQGKIQLLLIKIDYS